eukprot:GHRR01003385.1.p1 GENE.GHRR01003385.1~~GHRR01003385.1.p1  ORF type:complete len:1192 (+),score=313.72 GHRR01003385.1:611-4186(+)
MMVGHTSCYKQHLSALLTAAITLACFVLRTAQQPLSEANCSLSIFGYGTARPGVQHCSISCISNNQQPINISSSNISSITQANGVNVVGYEDCQQQGSRLGGYRVAMSAFLYFCGSGYHIRLLKPVVRNVWLQFDSEGSYSHAVLAFGGQVTTSIVRGHLNSNQASALLVMGAAQLTVQDSMISNNYAYSGAGILVLNGSLSVNNSTFQDNMSIDQGAGIYCLTDSDVQVTASTFIRNKASASGGGIAASYSAAVRVSDTTFEGNTAQSVGGAVQGRNNATIHISHSYLTHNSGSGGGAAALQNAARLEVHSTTLCDNAGAGGVLDLRDASRASFLNCTLCRNKSPADGGAALLYDSAILALNSSKVAANRATFGGGVAVHASAAVVVNNTQFLENDAQAGGAVYGDQTSKVTIDKQSMIERNVASTGGGVYSTDQNAVSVVGGSELLNNTAKSDGGGIYLGGTAVLRLSEDAVITDNYAQRRGGGMYMDSYRFNKTRALAVTRSNMAATGGQEMSVRMINMAIMDPDAFVESFNNRAQPQVTVPVNVSGFYGMPCGGLLVQAYLDHRTFLGVSKSGEDGIANLVLNVRATPGPHNITFSLVENFTAAVDASLDVRSCIIGEVAPSHDTCEVCPLGRYSFNPGNSSCTECPSNARCPGGAIIIPEPGFWRSTATSTQLHRCRNPDACSQANALPAPTTYTCPSAASGASSNADIQCAQGYHGNLCGLCSTGYGANKAFTCRQCLEQSAIIGLYAFSGVVMLAFIKLICHLNIMESKCLTTSTQPDALRATDLLKQLVLYMQYMLIIANVGVSWPVTLFWPLQALATAWAVASPETLSIDCLFADEGAMPFATRKVLFYLLFPVALLLLLLLLEALIAWRVAHAQSMAEAVIADRLLSSTMVVIFLFIPSTVRVILGMFACVPLDKPSAAPYCAPAVGHFWVYDMNQSCFEAYHAAWAFGLGLPLLLLVCVALPVGISVFTVRNRQRLSTPSFRQHYSFLYRQYRPAFCFWDAVVLVQTMVLVAAGVFGAALGPYYQILILNAVFVAILLLLLIIRPHAHRQTGIVAVQSICCLLLTCYALQSLIPYDKLVSADNAYLKVYGIVIGAIVLTVNLTYIASVMWRFYKLTRWSKLIITINSNSQRILTSLSTCPRSNLWHVHTRYKTARVGKQAGAASIDGNASRQQLPIVEPA